MLTNKRFRKPHSIKLALTNNFLMTFSLKLEIEKAPLLDPLELPSVASWTMKSSENPNKMQELKKEIRN
jgi:hypothetical protein